MNETSSPINPEEHAPTEDHIPGSPFSPYGPAYIDEHTKRVAEIAEENGLPAYGPEGAAQPLVAYTKAEARELSKRGLMRALHQVGGGSPYSIGFKNQGERNAVNQKAAERKARRRAK